MSNEKTIDKIKRLIFEATDYSCLIPSIFKREKTKREKPDSETTRSKAIRKTPDDG